MTAVESRAGIMAAKIATESVASPGSAVFEIPTNNAARLSSNQPLLEISNIPLAYSKQTPYSEPSPAHLTTRQLRVMQITTG